MALSDRINAVFPKVSDIPTGLLKGIPFTQTAYMVNGEIRHWEGPLQQVLSPVQVVSETGRMPFPVGAYPLLSEKEALQALDAAVTAYDHGRGQWPTLSVAERIHHMEQFVFRMLGTERSDCTASDVGNRQTPEGLG